MQNLLSPRLLLYALLPGIILGIVGGYTLKGVLLPKQQLSPDAVKTFAGTSSKTSTPSKGKNPLQAATRKTELDAELQRISTLTVPQMLEEIKIWEQKLSQNSPWDYLTYTPSSYLAWRLGKEAPRQTILELEKYDRFTYYNILDLMTGWLEKNPDDAINWSIENKTFFSHRFLLSSTLVKTYVKMNPDKAFLWIKSIKDASRTDTALAAFDSILSFHPEKTKEYLSFLQSINSDFVNEIAAQQLANKDWDAAKRYISSFPEKDQPKMWENIMGYLNNNTSLNNATEEWKKFPPDLQKKTLPSLMESLLKDSPLRGLDWIRSNIPEEQAAKILNEGKSIFLYRCDEPSFQQSVAEIPSGAFKDAILEKMIDWGDSAFCFTNFPELNFENHQPETVLSWVLEISNKKQRQSHLDNFLGSWYYAYPQKVREWMNNAPLLQTDKELIKKKRPALFDEQN